MTRCSKAVTGGRCGISISRTIGAFVSPLKSPTHLDRFGASAKNFFMSWTSWLEAASSLFLLSLLTLAD
jgi:hypothetical protein